MALFPNPGPELFNEHDNEMRQKMEASYYYAITMNQAFWVEADLDTQFEAGNQQAYQNHYGLNQANQHNRNFTFNRIRRIVNMVTGFQRRNRKSTIVTPVENGDQDTADQFTKSISWIHRQDGTLETISDAFHGALVSGMNLLQIWMDYRNDPINGNIRVQNLSYNRFIIDPYFREPDLSDCSFIWKRSYISKREAISLLPDKEDEIMQLNAGEHAQDEKFHYMPENFNHGPRHLLTYDEYYYRSYRTKKLLVDTNTGDTQEWTGDEEKLNEFLELYPEIEVIRQEVPTVRLAIVVQGRVMYDGPNPVGIDEYPFVPVFAFYRPELPYFEWRIQGIVRDLRDAQYLYNRRKVIELDILESQVNSGWKFKENALVNPKDVFLTGQGRSLAVKQEASLDDVQPIQPAQIPQSMFQLSQDLSQEIQHISGVNEELLGSAQDDKAGVLSMLRQGAGLTTLQMLFDQLDNAQRILGRRIIYAIQRNFTPGKIKKITEEEPTSQFYNKAFGVYDAAVEQGINTATQKQMEFAQLLQLREYGVQIPDDMLLESATLQNKNDIIKRIQEQQQQQQQQQQRQQELQEEQARATIEATEAQAKESTGQGLERLSRVQENQALTGERRAKEQANRALQEERVAEARENRAQARENRNEAYLNAAKAVREAAGLDIDNLYKLIEVARKLQQEYEAEQRQVQWADEESQRPRSSGLDSLNVL